MHALFRSLGLSLIAVASLALGGCAHHASQSRNDPYYDNRSNVQYGQILSIEQDFSGDRPGRNESSAGGGGGALVGGVIGGVIGNQVGKGNGRTAATLIGAVGGAIVGNEIERQNQQQQYPRSAPYPQSAQRERSIFHVLVHLDNRSEQWFDFERIDGLRVGDRVRIENGRLQRY